MTKYNKTLSISLSSVTILSASSQGGGGDTTTQSSSSIAETTQDGDSDGVPDANDNCPNTPYLRCFLEKLHSSSLWRQTSDPVFQLLWRYRDLTKASEEYFKNQMERK
jgi:hypothetical protein